VSYRTRAKSARRVRVLDDAARRCVCLHNDTTSDRGEARSERNMAQQLVVVRRCEEDEGTRQTVVIDR